MLLLAAVAATSRIEDTANIFTATVAADRYRLFEPRLAAAALLLVAARDVRIKIQTEREIDADMVLFELPAGEIGIDQARIESRRLDEVVTNFGGLGDRPRTFIVTPARFPDQRVQTELVHDKSSLI
jgi:hypothetical protein